MQALDSIPSTSREEVAFSKTHSLAMKQHFFEESYTLDSNIEDQLAQAPR